MEKTEKKTAEEISKAKIEHLEKLYRFYQFLNQIRYPDMTAGYMNSLHNLI